MATLRTEILTETDPIVRLDRQVEFVEDEEHILELKLDFYDRFLARVATTLNDGTFLAPTKADFTYFETRWSGNYSASIYKDWKDAIDNLDTMNNKMSVYKENLNTFESYVRGIYTLYELDLVVYDETENFKDHDNDHFDYPFDPRKSNVARMSFDYLNENQKLKENFYEVYKYQSQNIMF